MLSLRFLSVPERIIYDRDIAVVEGKSSRYRREGSGY
jgi:hypothetical protein